MDKKIFVFAILLFAGCKKSPYHQDYLPGPLYSIPAEMKEWTMFKPGSYWVYKNEKTNKTDSSNYKYGPYYEEIPCGNCPVRQNMWFFVNSPVFVKFMLKGGADSNAMLEITSRNIGEKNALTYYTLVHPDSSSNTSDYSESYECLGIFDSIVLNGITFTNVISTRVITRDFYDENEYLVESWFARHIGLIKYHEQSEKGDTTWSLVQWNTVQ